MLFLPQKRPPSLLLKIAWPLFGVLMEILIDFQRRKTTWGPGGAEESYNMGNGEDYWGREWTIMGGDEERYIVKSRSFKLFGLRLN